MTQNPANIVQAEFFHIDIDNGLTGVMDECAERIADGSPIKTVVRFYDADGSITALVQARATVEEVRQSLSERIDRSKGWRRKWLSVRHRRTLRTISVLQEKIRALIVRKLQYAIKNGGSVAIERHNRSFRPMRKTEAHELTEATANAKHVWVFIFHPNDLYADEVSGVVYAM